MDTIVTVENGKYRFVIDSTTGAVRCDRFGAPWMTFYQGTKALIALIAHTADLETRVDGKKGL
jgi:hypothetical protein